MHRRTTGPLNHSQSPRALMKIVRECLIGACECHMAPNSSRHTRTTASSSSSLRSSSALKAVRLVRRGLVLPLRDSEGREAEPDRASALPCSRSLSRSAADSALWLTARVVTGLGKEGEGDRRVLPASPPEVDKVAREALPFSPPPPLPPTGGMQEHTQGNWERNSTERNTRRRRETQLHARTHKLEKIAHVRKHQRGE